MLPIDGSVGFGANLLAIISTFRYPQNANLVLSGRVSLRRQCLMRPLISGLPQRVSLRELNGSLPVTILITSLETSKPKRLRISGVSRWPEG